MAIIIATGRTRADFRVDASGAIRFVLITRPRCLGTDVGLARPESPPARRSATMLSLPTPGVTRTDDIGKARCRDELASSALPDRSTRTAVCGLRRTPHFSHFTRRTMASARY
jgi:hypothetical protein